MISARFHAICLSLHFKKPFIALSSNTFKIESLLNDIGISKSRILTKDKLFNLNMNNMNKKYMSLSDEEILKIDKYLITANDKIIIMFKDIHDYINTHDIKL